MIYIRKRNETNVIESIILEIYKPINLQTYKIILRQLFNENITSLSSLQLWTILKLCKNITKQNKTLAVTVTNYAEVVIKGFYFHSILLDFLVFLQKFCPGLSVWKSFCLQNVHVSFKLQYSELLQNLSQIFHANIKSSGCKKVPDKS